MKKLYIFSLFTFLFSLSAFAAEKDINQWNTTLHRIQDMAVGYGISDRVINEVIQEAQFMPRVIERDRNQPEFRMTLQQYLNHVINQNRINTGRRMARQYRTLLSEVQARHRVQPHVILAFWGMESNFGTIMGANRISDAMLTLIYDGRRGTFFTNQLIAVMRHADRNDLPVDGIRGSWAGAMGHFQFIPTTLARYGTDGDGDGRIDIIGNLPDAMHSAGNYLRRLGWNPNERICRTVRLPENFDWSLCNARTRKELSEWARLGITNPDGSAIPRVVGMRPGIVCDERDNNRDGYLVYENFFRVRRWNNSNHFGVAICLLSEQIRTP
ncbi:MAG: lytic murein transglycosylase [Alphaproteobacteria bacterium]|nr:lytic murein transglycosylase [Alphaproteobacteria bacterium]